MKEITVKYFEYKNNPIYADCSKGDYDADTKSIVLYVDDVHELALAINAEFNKIMDMEPDRIARRALTVAKDAKSGNIRYFSREDIMAAQKTDEHKRVWIKVYELCAAAFPLFAPEEYRPETATEDVKNSIFAAIDKRFGWQKINPAEASDNNIKMNIRIGIEYMIGKTFNDSADVDDLLSNHGLAKDQLVEEYKAHISANA